MPPARVQLAVRTAERFLQRRGLRRLPVDPFAIAASLDIVVQPKPETVDGVSGMLLWRGTTFGILYATHIDNAGFQRFSVSHELGHYLRAGPSRLSRPGRRGLACVPRRLCSPRIPTNAKRMRLPQPS